MKKNKRPHPLSIAGLLHRAKQMIDPLDARILLAFILQKDKSYLIAHSDKKLDNKTAAKFERLTQKRSGGKPIAYLIGRKEFYGLEFAVNRFTLIPRPETELVVKYAVTVAKRAIDQNPRTILIDIGTGCGCIPISLYAELKKQNKHFHKIIATDISAPALKMAAQNADKHRVDMELLQGDLLGAFNRKDVEQICAHDIIITANLPYLKDGQYHSEPTIKFEPKQALVSSKRGLAAYDKLFTELVANRLKNIRAIIIEIDPSQAEPIKLVAKKHFPGCRPAVLKDFSRQFRVVRITF